MVGIKVEGRHSAPEDWVAAVLDVVEECLDVLARALPLVLVEPDVAIAPIDRPESSDSRVAQARDREPGVWSPTPLQGGRTSTMSTSRSAASASTLSWSQRCSGIRSRAHCWMRWRSVLGRVVTAHKVAGAAGYSPGPALAPTESDRGVVERHWRSVNLQVIPEGAGPVKSGGRLVLLPARRRARPSAASSVGSIRSQTRAW